MVSWTWRHEQEWLNPGGKSLIRDPEAEALPEGSSHEDILKGVGLVPFTEGKSLNPDKDQGPQIPETKENQDA